MQLGTRWSVGAEPPARLSEDMRAAVASVEAERNGNDTSMWRWTLTWLEGHPMAELEDGTTVREGHDGSITITTDDPEL